MMLFSVLFLLPSFSAAIAQADCNGQTCASAPSASMLQLQLQSREQESTHLRLNYSSDMFKHSAANQELFDLIKEKAAELLALYTDFVNSDFMKKLCGEAGNWECDPSKISIEDLKALMEKYNLDPAVIDEAQKLWGEIVALLEKPMAWIKQIMDDWLPKLKAIVLETFDKIKAAGMEGYFTPGKFDFTAFTELFQVKEGKSGLTRFFETAAYVAEELDASKLVGQMLDDIGKLFKKLQAAIMALPSDKVIDWAKESGLLDGLQEIETELDAFFKKVLEDFVNFENANNFLEDPTKKAAWEGKNIAQVVAMCVPIGQDYDAQNCQIVQQAAVHAGTVTVAFQALRVMNSATDSARLLQQLPSWGAGVGKDHPVGILSNPDAGAGFGLEIQKVNEELGPLNTDSPKADVALATEAIKLSAKMEEVDKEANEKKPAGGSSTSLKKIWTDPIMR